MSDVRCRIEGDVGRVTLNRPKALNALSHEMCLEIEVALDAWRGRVSCVVIDAEGDKAFCAGGDIAALYQSAQRGDIEYGRGFWQDEYRLNAKLSDYPVPVVSFLQGFVMGGGVGLGCHVSHRIVCETTKVAMPECGIGLIPDVGGSLILANAPGQFGAYLGLTGARLSGGDAITCGFADTFVSYESWPEIKRQLVETGDVAVIAEMKEAAPDSEIALNSEECVQHFSHSSVLAIEDSLKAQNTEFSQRALKGLHRGAPLAACCCLEVLKLLRGTDDLRTALALEFRFTARAVAQGDFPEGIRAAIVDKDNAPRWAHDSIHAVTERDIAVMLADLGEDSLNLENQL